MTILLPVKPKTVSTLEKERLLGLGVIVVEHEHPEEMLLSGEQHHHCCLDDVLVRFLTKLAQSVGPNYDITAKGSIELNCRQGTGGGPPLNADRTPLSPNNNKTSYTYTNQGPQDIWFFVEGVAPSAVSAGTPSNMVNPQAFAVTALANATQKMPKNAFRIGVQEKVVVTYAAGNAPSLSWCVV